MNIIFKYFRYKWYILHIRPACQETYDFQYINDYLYISATSTSILKLDLQKYKFPISNNIDTVVSYQKKLELFIKHNSREDGDKQGILMKNSHFDRTLQYWFHTRQDVKWQVKILSS